MPSRMDKEVMDAVAVEKKVDQLLRHVKYRRRMSFRCFTYNGTCYVQVILNSVRNVEDPKAPRSEVSGRWWVVGEAFDRDTVLRTLFAAASELETHERMERFQYKGKSVFNPHKRLG